VTEPRDYLPGSEVKALCKDWDSFDEFAVIENRGQQFTQIEGAPEGHVTAKLIEVPVPIFRARLVETITDGTRTKRRLTLIVTVLTEREKGQQALALLKQLADGAVDTVVLLEEAKRLTSEAT
jgi:hypothetical protein